MAHIHKKEICRWASMPYGTKIWEKDTYYADWELRANVSWDESSEYIVDDEWAELRKAEADGKNIEYRGPDGEWYDLSSSIYDLSDEFTPIGITVRDYRIKPEIRYPIFMLAYTHPKCFQYIVKFTDLRKGTVVAAAENCHLKIGDSSNVWFERTDTKTWQEVNDPNKLFDKDAVEAWDDSMINGRTLRIYKENKNRKETLSFYDNGGLIEFENYRKLMPWEIPDWMYEVKKRLNEKGK